MIDFLNQTIHYESKQFESNLNNFSSEIVGLIPQVLRCLLSMSETGEECKLLFGELGLFSSLFGNKYLQYLFQTKATQKVY